MAQLLRLADARVRTVWFGSHTWKFFRYSGFRTLVFSYFSECVRVWYNKVNILVVTASDRIAKWLNVAPRPQGAVWFTPHGWNFYSLQRVSNPWTFKFVNTIDVIGGFPPFIVRVSIATLAEHICTIVAESTGALLDVGALSTRASDRTFALSCGETEVLLLNFLM